MLHHAWPLFESKRAPSAKPIEKGSRGKRRLDPPGGEKGEEATRAAITHWPCWLERESVATFQEKHQEDTGQVQQK